MFPNRSHFARTILRIDRFGRLLLWDGPGSTERRTAAIAISHSSSGCGHGYSGVMTLQTMHASVARGRGESRRPNRPMRAAASADLPDGFMRGGSTPP
jgi:hypothetical protein